MIISCLVCQMCHCVVRLSVVFVLLLNLPNLKRQDVQCGALTLKTELLDLSLLNMNLSVLNTAVLGFTQKERIWQSQYISELDGPVIVWFYCKDKVGHGKFPKFLLPCLILSL